PDVCSLSLHDALPILIEEKRRGPVALGLHDGEGLPVYVKRGPFGPYVQLGDVTEENPKPKRAGIPNCFDPETLDLETAIQLLELDRKSTRLNSSHVKI